VLPVPGPPNYFYGEEGAEMGWRREGKRGREGNGGFKKCYSISNKLPPPLPSSGEGPSSRPSSSYRCAGM